MKGKKVLKVLMAAMVIVTMLAQVAVFATTDDLYFTTDTVYDLDSGKAKVKSTVYGIGKNEEVTFLVENKDEILYIDQINTADYVTTGTESASFTYLIDAEDANGTATVKFASTSNAATAVNPEEKDVDDTIKLNKVTVTYSATEGGSVFFAPSEDDTVEEDALDGEKTEKGYEDETLTFYVVPDMGYVYEGYKWGNNEKVIGDSNNGEVTVNIPAEDSSLVFYFTSKAIETKAEAKPTFAKIGDFELISSGTATEDDKTLNTVETFATISDMAGVKEFGVLISKSEITEDNWNEARKFAAAGHIDNKYGVRLVDNENVYLTEKVYVRTYAIYLDSNSAEQISLGEEVSLYDDVTE